MSGQTIVRALVTGGAGFIGSHLVERLIQRGASVIVIDDLSTGSLENLPEVVRDSDRFEFEQESIESSRALESHISSCDAIFHLAAAVGVRYVMSARVRTIRSNVDSTATLLKYASRSGVPVFIASTSEVYGSADSRPLSEEDPLRIGSPDVGRWCYAASKAMCEYLALAHAREDGLPVVIGRMFNTSGPRQSARYGMVLPRFVSQAMAGEPITVYGDGTQTRCFAHVSDVVGAITRLMESPGAMGHIFNIGRDEETSIGSLAERVRLLTGSASRIVNTPFEEVYSDFADMKRRVPDLTKIQQWIGYEPAVGLDQIILDLVESLR